MSFVDKDTRLANSLAAMLFLSRNWQITTPKASSTVMAQI
jgi:hypothetical protein